MRDKHPPHQVESGPTLNNPPRYGGGVAYEVENTSASPNIFPDTISEGTDVQTIWLPDLENELDLLGRDLAGAPSLESFNYYDFAPFTLDPDVNSY
jgi:hypothetical protein